MSEYAVMLSPKEVIDALQRYIVCRHPHFEKCSYEALYLVNGILVREIPEKEHA